MYVSKLLIDVGENPDRPRPGRLWLRNIYAVHQRLCMAFPDKKRRAQDPQFLNPYASQDFAAARARDGRSSTAGILYRIDPLPGSRAMILVLSAEKPVWEYAFQNAGMLLAAEPEIVTYDPEFRQGARYRFRILMNLTERTKRPLLDEDRRPVLDEQGQPVLKSRRFPVTWDKDASPLSRIWPWFDGKRFGRLTGDEVSGEAFNLMYCGLSVNLGWVQGYKPVLDKDKCQPGTGFKPEHKKLRFRSALLEGILRVEDEQAFARLVASGIGAAKAFGFGLLSVRKLS